MGRLQLLSFVLLLGLQTAFAQNFVLQGKVVDEDQHALEFVTVRVASQGKITMTTLHGDYKLNLKSADSVVVTFSLIGYKTKTRVLRRPQGKQTLQVVLQQHNALAEVVVEGQRKQTTQNQELKTKDTKLLPTVSGNAIEELIQTQPGVSSHDELSSQYNVRGGSFDENVVFINGLEIYRPFLVRSGQQEGLSVINPYMVDQIHFSTGGYAVKYGDQMSSALDITYKTLKPRQFEASFVGSLLGADAYIGFATKSLTWLNSIRYKTNRYLLGSLDSKGEYKPNHFDYQTYMRYTPNKHWEISMIGNINDSRYTFIPKSRSTTYGTADNALNFKVYFNGKEKDLFTTYFGSIGISRLLAKDTKLSLLASAYSTHEREAYDIEGQYWLNQTGKTGNLAVGTYFEHSRDYLNAHVETMKLMFQHKPAKHDWEAAVLYKREHIDENYNEYEMRDSAGYIIPHTGKDLQMIYALKSKQRLNTSRTEAYIQDIYRFTNARQTSFFTLSYGVRMSYWDFNKETIVSPRLSLAYTPSFSTNSVFRMATGIYYQAPFYKELRDTVLMDGVTRVNLNRKIKSQRSIHFILGYEHNFMVNKQKYKFSAEAYYKALSNLVPYTVNNMKVVYTGLNQGTGHAMGLDFKLYGEFVPGTDSWISLSLMDTRMKLNGKSVSLPTDQRYAISLFFTDYFPSTDRWKAGLKLIFADGLPFFAPHREFDKTVFRASPYKRVDLSVSYRLYNHETRDRKSILKNIWLSVEGLNLFGVNNVNSYYWITDISNVQYAIPNFLTGRRFNTKLRFDF